jgi:hypothetical protein
MKQRNTMETKLTEKETALLNKIVSMYSENDNICYLIDNNKCTPSEKGVLSSLLKKGLIYDSSDDFIGLTSNYFPATK